MGSSIVIVRATVSHQNGRRSHIYQSASMFGAISARAAPQSGSICSPFRRSARLQYYWPSALRRQRSDVRIVSGAPLRYRTGHAKTRRFRAFSGDERAQEDAFRSHDAQFFLIDFDALGERAEVIAAVATAIGPHTLARRPGKRLERFRCDRRSGAFNRILGSLRVKAGLVARGLQFTDPVLQHGVGQIGDAILDW
jgi:hypothetical protein